MIVSELIKRLSKVNQSATVMVWYNDELIPLAEDISTTENENEIVFCFDPE